MSIYKFERDFEISLMKSTYEKEICKLKNELKAAKIINYKNIINNENNPYKNTKTIGLMVANNCSFKINNYTIDELIENIKDEVLKFLSLTEESAKNNKRSVYFYWMENVNPDDITIDMIETFDNFCEIICCNNIFNGFIKKLKDLGYTTDNYIFDIINSYQKINEIKDMKRDELKKLYTTVFNKSPFILTFNNTIKTEIINLEKKKLKNKLLNHKN